MVHDIRFYDLDFNLLYILPPVNGKRGYKSINTCQEYNDSGDLEIVFCDDSLKRIVETYRDNLLVTWNGFQGFLTSYRWTEKECRLFGMHLNGLLHRAVIATTEESTNTVRNIAKTALSTISWLTVINTDGGTSTVTYGTDKPETADTFLQNLFKSGRCGYCISADIANKQYVFTILQRKNNPLMLSVSNLNAYEMEITYINKELANGGWYKLDDVWTYITNGNTKEGIHNIDTVLDAQTAAEAQNELKQCKGEYEVIASTLNISYGTDYSIGDIVRVQSEGITQKQLVSGVSRWQEEGYGEKPVLSDSEEDL